MSSEHVGFGGGCHWCTEAVFNALKGVTSVEQGFIQSVAPDHKASEAVQIHFDSTVISLAVLIEIHLRTHSSTSNHNLRKKYRSAVYITHAEQSREATDAITLLAKEFEKSIVTRVLPLEAFIASPKHYQKYYENHATGQFCQRFIDPKLALLSRQFRAQIITTKDVKK